MHMRKIMLVAVLALVPTLGGCATLQKLQDSLHVVTAARVSPKGVIIAAETFNTLEGGATRYLRLPRCTGTNGPICRDPALRVPIKTAILKGRAARDELIAFRNEHPGELGLQGAYDALNKSINTLRGLIPYSLIPHINPGVVR